MMRSITNDKRRDSWMKKYGIQVLAAAFWIAVWQLASMWLGQEILLASPVSVIKKLGELIVTYDFWKSVGFSFGRIVLGFLLALVTGCIQAVVAYRFSFAAVLFGPLITVIKSTPVASFIILCLIWIPSRNLSVFISFLMVLPVVYTNILQGIRQTDRKLLEMACDLTPEALSETLLWMIRQPEESRKYGEEAKKKVLYHTKGLEQFLALTDSETA